MLSPPRRGASTGKPAGLSRTSASASMNRMRSERFTEPSLRGAQRRSNPAKQADPRLLRSARNDAHKAMAVDDFVTPLQHAKETSALGNINLFPSDLEWLMDASRPLRAVYALGLGRGDQQCACC